MKSMCSELNIETMWCKQGKKQVAHKPFIFYHKQAQQHMIRMKTQNNPKQV